MLRPGHAEVSRPASTGFPGYRLVLDYHVEGPEQQPEWARFHLHGEVDRKTIDDQFSMHRDVAFNFLQRIRQSLHKHGVPLHQAVLFGFHRIYDPLFGDLRRQLHGMPGEPVDIERFLHDT